MTNKTELSLLLRKYEYLENKDERMNVDVPPGDNEKIVVAMQQDPLLLIGLADRLTRSSGDKHPFENFIPVPRVQVPRENGHWNPWMIYCSA